MRAIQISEFGGPDKLQLASAAEPSLRANDLLIRVIASGVNAIEWKIRTGAMARALARPLPATLGWECAGVVAAIGPQVTGFSVGDEVFAYPEFSRDGTHADYVCVDAGQAALKPRSLSFRAAAVVPMTAQAAWTALGAASLGKNERLLVHGAGGAVGHWLVQLAKARGCHVVGTASGAGVNAVRLLGADEVVDYRRQRFEAAGPFEAVIDLVGGETQERSWSVLEIGGRLVSTVTAPAPEREGRKGTFVFTPPRGDILSSIAVMIDDHLLRPLPIGNAFPLADAAKAHALGESGQMVGKAVLEIQES